MIYFLRPEKVAEAFMHLVEEEDSNGKILTIMTHNGIQEHKYVVGKSMLWKKKNVDFGVRNKCALFSNTE